MENFMDSDQAWVFIKQFVLEPIGAEIDQLRENLFKSAWDGKTYEAIAEKLGYEGSYIRDRGSRLLKSIGQAINHPIDKHNFRQVIQEYCATIATEVAASSFNSSFMGRSADLLALQELQKDNPIVLIQGAGGLGKTTLARKYLESQGCRVLEIWMAAETADLVSTAANVVEEWLGGEFASQAGRDFAINLDRLRRCLRTSSQPIGVLIDNLDSILDGHGRLIDTHRCYLELLRLLADPGLKVVTVITSRERLRESLVEPSVHKLEGLSEVIWTEYFHHHQLRVSPSTITETWRLCGGNPKAMKLLRGAANADFEGDLDAYWQAIDGNLLADSALQHLVHSQFDRLQQTNLPAYQLLCRLGSYRYRDVPFVPLLAVKSLLWDWPEPERQAVIQDLRDRSLIESRQNQKFWLHPMIQTEAIQRLGQGPEWEETHRHAAQFWLDHVTTVATVEDALQILEAYHHYLEIADYEQACEVIVTRKPNRWKTPIEVGWLFYRLSLLQQMTLAITRIIDHISIDERAGRLHNLLGYIHRLSGEMGQATIHHQQALDIADQLPAGSPASKLRISAWFNLGLCARDFWETDRAFDYFRAVKQLATTINYTDYIIYANCCLAYLHSCDGEHGQAMNLVRTMPPLRLQEQVSSWGAGCSLLYIAHTHQNLGELEAATELYQDTLMYAQANQFTHIAAKAMSGLAQVDTARHNYTQAIARHDQAIDQLQQISAQCDLAEAYLQRGLTYRRQGELAQSKQDVQRAGTIFQTIHAKQRLDWIDQTFGHEGDVPDQL
jgi:tetratricopeptide (TPR) repeat protein